ncbi:hypothetical protein, partial [Acidithiobacillus caldus]|uniref:hypothetical protein n=1 Tax=Acidithiobacillus caldus TaxID=33059 RepID=UPI001F524024
MLPVFAIGVYGLARAALPFPFASLQNREQHRRQPQRRAAALLCLVPANPKLALRVPLTIMGLEAPPLMMKN